VPKPIQHTRILRLPVPESICAGHLDAFLTHSRDRRLDLVLDYRAQVSADRRDLIRRDGRIFEHSRWVYLPRRLCFSAVSGLKITGLYQDLDRLPPEHTARTIVDMYSWKARGESLSFFLLFGRSVEDAEIRFHAARVKSEKRDGEAIPFSIERDWSPAPPMPARLVPQPRAIHQRFGGDPVSLYLDGRHHPHRLFVGGWDIQPDLRPDVHAVLNLGEDPSRWVKGGSLPACDRWINMGEGSRGMSPEDIRREAGWVIERLRSGQRVLVHCAAGMNRSVTICCAVLIMLEGLSSGDALQRIRLHHPWARPDSHHWLALKWLASGEKL
jgi:hypothetical protein